MTIIKFDMIEIPESPFLMGTDENKENDTEYHEEPERKVWLSTYQIQKTPITVEDWQKFLSNTGYDWKFQDKVIQKSPTQNHPITYVSWHDAYRFTEWLRDILGDNYNLPTEAQWEKACRGKNGQLYPWGNEKPDWENEFLPYLESNLTIGFRSEWQSPYGCLDMWQNVSEWCLDWFDYGDYYHNPSVQWINPTGPVTGDKKIFRGGNPLTSGWPRCTYRGRLNPESRHYTLGFRVVLNL